MPDKKESYDLSSFKDQNTSSQVGWVKKVYPTLQNGKFEIIKLIG